MPADKELHFGFTGPKEIWDAVQNIDGRLLNELEPMTFDLLQSSTFDTVEFEPSDSLKAALTRAYENTLTRLGYRFQKSTEAYLSDRYYDINTPWGVRTAHSWDLCIQYDPDEIGDALDEMTLGVDLSSRYFPCLVDLKDPNGTLGSVVKIKSLMEMDATKIAIEEIIKAIPYFANAELYLRDIWY